MTYADKTMNADQINLLPEDVRKYIHDLETRCDPSGDLQQIASLKEQVAGLTRRLADRDRSELPEVIRTIGEEKPDAMLDLRKLELENSDLRRRLKHAEDGYKVLAAHHNQHCTCMGIY